jgi:hypothetical protein
MKITKRQLRRIIREELDREESFADDQRKIGRMFTRFDRAQIKQAMELNSVLGILPEPINISFPHEDWTELTDDERRELEGIPADKYPNDFPMQPNVLVDIDFATAEDAELWKGLWVEEAGACLVAGTRGCNYIANAPYSGSQTGSRFWIWKANP